MKTVTPRVFQHSIANRLLWLVVIQSLFMMVVLLTVFIMPYTPLSHSLADVVHFFIQARSVLDGNSTFSQLRLEYPFLAFFLMMVPAFGVTSIKIYTVLFVGQIIVWNAFCSWLVVRWVVRQQGEQAALRSAWWYCLWMVLLTPFWGMRLDVPIMTILFASFSLLRDRPIWAAILGIIGGYIKLIPAVVTAVALRIRHDRQTVIVVICTTLVIGCCWWLSASTGMLYAFHYHEQRGIELGSLYASVLFWIGKILHWQMSIDFRYSSAELSTPLSDGIRNVVPILQILALLFPMWRFRGGTTESHLRLVIGLLLGYMVFGKVLSPQYIIWLVPFYAILKGTTARRQQTVFTGAVLLTVIIFPFLFNHLRESYYLVFFATLIRNGLLLWLYWQAVQGSPSVEMKRENS